ncbi:acetylglutamate kinase [bacterium 1xD42-67]|nr:acetylglutamate kinase [bacterium 1xD42-67]
MNEIANKVETMLEALPYLSRYTGKIVVIKYGGNAMINEELKANVIKDVVLLKALGLKPVLCHGGGPGINKMLEQLDIPVKFINGLRYTSEEIIRVVEMVLIGQVNSELVGRINGQGGRAVGLSGISGDLFQCIQRSEELGYVGDVVKVNAEPVLAMLDAGFIPVVAPVGTDGRGTSFNINGDTAASKLAGALKAEKLMILTDIEGLCNDIKVRDVISYLNVADVQGLKDQGTIAGGMIPKVDCCVQAIEEGVTSVHIIDGRQPHSMLYEAFSSEGIGTTVGTAQPSVGIKWNK